MSKFISKILLSSAAIPTATTGTAVSLLATAAAATTGG